MAERTLIYVCRHAVDRNQREGATFPPIVVRHPGGETVYANDVEIKGPSRVVYDREGLHDGTKVWIETSAPVAATPA